MGLDLTWKEEDRIRFGNCSKYLEEIVRAHFPKSSGFDNGGISSSPERNSNYVLNEPDLWPVSKLNLPDGEKTQTDERYAIEYTTMTLELSREETEERLRKAYEEMYKDKMPNKIERENFIKKRIESHFDRHSIDSIGTSYFARMEMKDGKANIDVKKFVRWVSKKEYGGRVTEAKKIIEKDEEEKTEVWVDNRWYSIKYEERDKICESCPLDTFIGIKENSYVGKLNKEIEGKNLEERTNFIYGIYKQLIPDKKGKTAEGEYQKLAEEKSPYLEGILNFLLENMDKISSFEKYTRKLIEEYGIPSKPYSGCYHGSSYSHFGTFFDFIKQYGDFEVLTWEYLNSDDGVPVELLDKMEQELEKSREILESTEVPAIKVYSRQGKLISTYPKISGHLYGNETCGYGVGLEDDIEGITLKRKCPGMFALSPKKRKEFVEAFLEIHGDKYLDTQGNLDKTRMELDAMMALSSMVKKKEPRMHFKEIYRERGTFYGRMCEGKTIELPPFPKGRPSRTPFAGYDNEERIGRMVYARVPAMESYEYIQKLLEKYLTLAKTFDIAIKGA